MRDRTEPQWIGGGPRTGGRLRPDSADYFFLWVR